MKKKIKIKENLIGKYKYFILLGFCGILAVFSVIMTIEVSATGAQISDLQKREIELSSQKRSLESQLVKASSMGDLQSKSIELGFVKPTEMVYLSQGLPVANISY